MARPLSADHLHSPKGDEGAPLQSLLRGAFRSKEESPLSSLLQAPARLHDPGKPREKTGDDIAGLRIVWQGGQALLGDEMIEYLEKYFPYGTPESPEVLRARLVRRLCPICAVPSCKWWNGHEIIWKE